MKLSDSAEKRVDNIFIFIDISFFSTYFREIFIQRSYNLNQFTITQPLTVYKITTNVTGKYYGRISLKQAVMGTQ